MQSFEFLIGKTKGKKSGKNRQIIEDNLDKITKYLGTEDIASLKLSNSCRPFYYHFVTAELWLGLKLNIAEQKLEYFDDFDFEETETKQISKKDKNIRIHSLKKQTQQGGRKIIKRQASNIKAKGKLINENNQLLFRNTEIGFKRLLKTNSKKKVSDVDYQIKQVSDLPKINDINQYIIKINDPWSVNMRKAQNLINLFKRINQFHHKFLTQLKIPCKEINNLLSKLKKVLQKSQFYLQIVSVQPYKSIIMSTEGAIQNLLIDEQLNKICRLFWKYHTPMSNINSQISSLKQILEKQKQKIQQATANNNKQSVQFIQSLSGIDQSVQLISNFIQTNKDLGSILCPQLINIYFGVVQSFQEQTLTFQDTNEQIRVDLISWRILVKKPFFSETLFQILVSLTSKLIKLSSSMCPDDLTLSITVNKLKSIKSVSQSLLNIAKYFGKIKKQIQQKQKKSKDTKTSDSIRQFLIFYENKQDENLYLTKNIAKLEKIIIDFKQRIANLKDKIQTN